ncbi:unnamed protein product [Macrosiphum euphorbiae]|uniref:Retropepsins domain-containing protein n=1 Tax=Macrosiphum euphorbiae TaxID=13131 RepID=A0AAV0X0J6_9HEMI|nr:unnamed protein product [Macrosiphum euphorbiae]
MKIDIEKGKAPIRETAIGHRNRRPPLVKDLREIYHIKQIMVAMENQHIKSRSINFINETLEFLVDTGSSVDIIRLSALTADTKLVPGEAISLREISITLETTICIVEIPIEIGTEIFENIKFYIVKNDMPLIKAGILGRPFFQLQNTTINMPYGCSTNTLTLGNHIRIPSRVEYIMAVGVDTGTVKDNEAITIHQGELQE